MTTSVPSTTSSAVMELRNVCKSFGTGQGRHSVLKDVNLAIHEGEAVGLVGESGSGKSTIGKIICGMYTADSGELLVEGTPLKGRQYRNAVRSLVSYIPQNPYGSFDPRCTVGRSLAEALDPRGASVRRQRSELATWVERVGMDADALDRYPHEFSGGQRQRLAIARALCRRPKIVVADEITSALDMSVQAQILAVIADLRRHNDFSMLFISHNLAVIQHVCSSVLVMTQGEIVERGETSAVLLHPAHPYTRKLVGSIPGSPTFSIEHSDIVTAK